MSSSHVKELAAAIPKSFSWICGAILGVGEKSAKKGKGGEKKKKERDGLTIKNIPSKFLVTSLPLHKTWILDINGGTGGALVSINVGPG